MPAEICGVPWWCVWLEQLNGSMSNFLRCPCGPEYSENEQKLKLISFIHSTSIFGERLCRRYSKQILSFGVLPLWEVSLDLLLLLNKTNPFASVLLLCFLSVLISFVTYVFSFWVPRGCELLQGRFSILFNLRAASDLVKTLQPSMEELQHGRGDRHWKQQCISIFSGPWGLPGHYGSRNREWPGLPGAWAVWRHHKELGDEEDFAGKKMSRETKGSFWRCTGMLIVRLLGSLPLLSGGSGKYAGSSRPGVDMFLIPRYIWQPILQGRRGPWAEKGKYTAGQSWMPTIDFVRLPSDVAASYRLCSLARCGPGVSDRRGEDFLLDAVQMGQTHCFLIYCWCGGLASWALGFPRHIWTAREDLVSPNNKDFSLSLLKFTWKVDKFRLSGTGP